MGFDTSLFLTQPVDDSLLCSICAGVFEKPRTACSNGHVYCEECLERTKAAMGNSCPDCRGQMLDPLPPSRTVINIIDKMKLNCEFSKSPTQLGDEQPSSRRRVSENGAAVVEDDANNRTLCGWQGLASNYREHTNTCGYRLVDCPRGCVDKVPFVLLDQHRNLECSRRRVSCSICHGRVRFCDLEKHTTTLCPEQNVRCEWCQEEMKRKELGVDRYQTGSCTDEAAENRYTGHYNTCPKILLPCEFSSLGCSSLIAREDKARHHADMAVTHSRLVSDAIDRETKTLRWSVAARYFYQREPISVESPKFEVAGYIFSILLNVSASTMKVRILLHSTPLTTTDVDVKAFRFRIFGMRSNHYFGYNEFVEGYVPELEDGFEHSQDFRRTQRPYNLTGWHPIRVMDGIPDNNENQRLRRMTRQMVTDFGSFDIRVEMEVKRPREIVMYSV